MSGSKYQRWRAAMPLSIVRARNSDLNWPKWRPVSMISKPNKASPTSKRPSSRRLRGAVQPGRSPRQPIQKRPRKPARTMELMSTATPKWKSPSKRLQMTCWWPCGRLTGDALASGMQLSFKFRRDVGRVVGGRAAGKRARAAEEAVEGAENVDDERGGGRDDIEHERGSHRSQMTLEEKDDLHEQRERDDGQVVPTVYEAARGVDDPHGSGEIADGAADEDEQNTFALIGVLRAEDPKVDLGHEPAGGDDGGADQGDGADGDEVVGLESIAGKTGKIRLEEDGVHLREDDEDLGETAERADVGDSGGDAEERDEYLRNLALECVKDDVGRVGQNKVDDGLALFDGGMAAHAEQHTCAR